ncbi:MAG: tRNA (guanine-N(7)-)-methyltransferase [Eubacteriales bacterium SKADARSKE-1]|nr:tRNA (guanine-N(7)-)-methyltransferase [Eubacteriales bacterium SKADARSKE-1]
MVFCKNQNARYKNFTLAGITRPHILAAFIMRIRRKPWARPEIEQCEFFTNNPLENKGHWHEKFSKKQPLYLELGCGKGTFISKIAVKNPNINFLALDIKSEMLALAKRNIEKEFEVAKKPIDNVLLASHDISRISTLLSIDDAVDRIYINFCNPWPKKKHKKRQLTHEKHLVQYKTFLKPKGEIYFKTDDDHLFNESIHHFLNNGFEIVYKTNDLHSSNFCKDNIETEHEKLFSSQGINIKFLIAKSK